MSRQIVIAIFIVLGVLGIIHLADAFIRGRKVYTVEVPVYSSKISDDLEGYTIAFVTDMHKMPDKKVDKLIEQIEKESPDLILIGGDFGGREYTKYAIESLGKIKTNDGIYGVHGNHDNSSRLFQLMEKNSMTPLNNTGEQVRPGFYVAGVADFWYRTPDIKKAISHAQKDDFVLLISHNPDLTMMQSTKDVDLTISGHTHGGEINFFGVWAPVITLTPKSRKVSNYGHRFFKGWCKSAEGTPVYVSRGIGSHLGFRVFAPAELTIFKLTNKEENKKGMA